MDGVLWFSIKKTRNPLKGFGFYREVFRQRPTLPLSFPSSTIGAEELNFRVRDGNGCHLFAIATENFVLVFGVWLFFIYLLNINTPNNSDVGTKKRSGIVLKIVAKPHDRLVPVS